MRLRDGSHVAIRPVGVDDEQALESFLGGLSRRARRMRFFGGAVDIPRSAHWAAEQEGARFGLLALGDSGRVVGHALFVPLDAERAEVAVEVADRLQDLGLGTVLIERLAIVAEERGIRYFVAEVLAENHAMLDVFREGFAARVTGRSGPAETVEFLTSGWRLARKRFDEHREEPG